MILKHFLIFLLLRVSTAEISTRERIDQFFNKVDEIEKKIISLESSVAKLEVSQGRPNWSWKGFSCEWINWSRAKKIFFSTFLEPQIGVDHRTK